MQAKWLGLTFFIILTPLFIYSTIDEFKKHKIRVIYDFSPLYVGLLVSYGFIVIMTIVLFIE